MAAISITGASSADDIDWFVELPQPRHKLLTFIHYLPYPVMPETIRRVVCLREKQREFTVCLVRYSIAD